MGGEGGVWRTRVGVEPETPRVQSTGGKVLGIFFFFLRHLPLKLYLCSPAFWKKKIGVGWDTNRYFFQRSTTQGPPEVKGSGEGSYEAVGG